MLNGLVSGADVQAFIRSMAKSIVGEQTAECQKGILGNVCQRQNGGQRILSPQVSGTVRQTIIDISGENAAAPQSVICTLAAKRLAEVENTAEPFYLRARITWGAGKQSQQVLLDYHHGTRICLDASSIRIDAEYTSLGAIGAELGPRFNVGVSLVYGNIGTQATLTDNYLDIATVSESALRPIPDFARTLTVLADEDLGAVAASALRIKFFASPIRDEVDIAVLPNTPVIIPNGVQYYSIFNASANTVRFNPIFQLYI